MNRQEIIDQIKAQGFPQGSYVVFGSGPLAAAGIRPTRDIDLVVLPSLYTTLQQQGWRFKPDPFGNPMLTNGVFEVSKGWTFGDYCPDFAGLMDSADVIDDVPFVNLQEVRKWKEQLAREKDLADIVQIDEYLSADQHLQNSLA